MALPAMEFMSPFTGGLYYKTAAAGLWTLASGVSTGTRYFVKTGNGIVVAYGMTNASLIYTSTDGVTWTQQIQASDYTRYLPWMAGGNNSGTVVGIERLGGYFFVVCGNSITISADGITWTNILRDKAPASGFRGIGLSAGKFIIVDGDGYTWTRDAFEADYITPKSPLTDDWTRTGKVFNTSQDILDVATMPQGNIYAVSREGHLYMYSGSAWSRIVISGFNGPGDKRLKALSGRLVVFDANRTSIWVTSTAQNAPQAAADFSEVNPGWSAAGGVIDMAWDGSLFYAFGRSQSGGVWYQNITSSPSMNPSSWTGRFSPSVSPNDYIRSADASFVLTAPTLTGSPADGASVTDPIITYTYNLGTSKYIGHEEIWDYNSRQFDTANTFGTANLIDGWPSDGQSVGGDWTGSTVNGPILRSDGTWYYRVRTRTLNGAVVTDWSNTKSISLTRFTVPAPTALALSGTNATYAPTFKANISSGTGVGANTQFALEFKFTPSATNDFTNPYATVMSSGTAKPGFDLTGVFAPNPADLLPSASWNVQVRQVDPRDGRKSTPVTINNVTITPGALATIGPGNYTMLPAQSSASSTSYPVFTIATPLDTSMANFDRKQRVQIQIATNAGFTTNASTFPLGDFVSQYAVPPSNTGKFTFTGAAPSRMGQTTWYYRWRLIDQYGVTSAAWSAAQIFSISHAPNAKPISPAANQLVTYSDPQVFTWEFGDSSPGDTQYAAEVLVTKQSDGSTVVTGSITGSNSNNLSLSIPTSMKGVPLLWRVRTTDNDGVQGPWSSGVPFYTIDAATVTITAPGSTISTGIPTVSWTLGGSAAQKSFTVTIDDVATGRTVWTTSGSTAQSVTSARTVLQNGSIYLVTVTVTTTLGGVTTAQIQTTCNYTPPASPTFTTDPTLYAEAGYVLIDWTSTAPDQYFYSWAVYRYDLNVDTDWQLIYSTTNSQTTKYRDWQAITGHNYVYVVTQSADRFGTLIESPVSTAGGTVSPVEGSWWLIDPDSEANNLRITVKADNFTDETEQTSYTVIGRGRRKEFGTRLGITGSLEVSFRPTTSLTAAQRFAKLRALQAARKKLVLRDAFGNRYNVVLGDISWAHVAGVGSTELIDATIPLEEVF